MFQDVCCLPLYNALFAREFFSRYVYYLLLFCHLSSMCSHPLMKVFIGGLGHRASFKHWKSRDKCLIDLLNHKILAEHSSCVIALYTAIDPRHLLGDHP